MKNKIRTFVFVLGIFVFQTSIAHATDYNYLPTDVGIKQKETLSALEYRLQSLESQLSNNPSISIGTINSRISELQSERDAEINYIRGLYAQNGISNQVDTKIAEITSKYQSQINSLESQKTSYQSQSDISAKETEIAELKLKIKQLEYDMQTSEYEKVTNTPQKQLTINDLFNWLESLPDDEEVAQYKLLKSMNPENAYKIDVLYREKYPEFFAQKENKPTTQVIPTSVQKKVETPKKVEPKIEEKVIDISTITPPTISVEVEKTPEVPKQTFVQRVFGFFKKLAFWR